MSRCCPGSWHVTLAACTFWNQKNRISYWYREVLLDALSPLGRPGEGIAGGEGAIYLWAKLPQGSSESKYLSSQISASAFSLFRPTPCQLTVNCSSYVKSCLSSHPGSLQRYMPNFMCDEQLCHLSGKPASALQKWMKMRRSLSGSFRSMESVSFQDLHVGRQVIFGLHLPISSQKPAERPHQSSKPDCKTSGIMEWSFEIHTYAMWVALSNFARASSLNTSPSGFVLCENPRSLAAHAFCSWESLSLCLALVWRQAWELQVNKFVPRYPCHPWHRH